MREREIPAGGFAPYRWVITRDMFWEERVRNGELELEIIAGKVTGKEITPKPETGTEGPWNVDSTMKLVKCFRMFTMDGNKIDWSYEGWASEECEFEPLDDFGRPNFGCEGIMYWHAQKMEWEPL